MAVVLTLAALILRLLMQPIVGDQVPYMTFFLALALAGAWLGIRAGILTLAASTVLATFFILQPQFAFFPIGLADGAGLLGFLGVGTMMLFFIDRSNRLRARDLERREAALASELREQRLIDAAHDFAIYELDREGRILTWNKGAERLKGWAAHEIIGKPYTTLHTPESRERNAPGRELKIAAETGRFEEEAPRLRKDGSVFAAHVSLFPLRDDSGEVTGYVKVTRDISERSKSGRAILESRRRMEAIVQSAMDAIISINEDGKVVLFNAAAEKIFRCSANEVLGQPVTNLMPERFRESHGEHVRRFFDSGVVNKPLVAEIPLMALRCDGEEFPIEASISQVTIGGERVGTIILRDITERKTSEEARALLAREVDHRAKNALAVAQALVGLTKAKKVEDFADAVRGRIASLSRAHSLLSQSQWRGAPLDQLIRDELLPYAREGQVTLDGPSISCSASAVQSLSLLFHELATNAVKHGALGSRNGHVQVIWELGEEALEIVWRERDGPKVARPSREGFGTKLLKQVTGRQLDADLQFHWNPGGLRVEIKLPVELFNPTKAPQVGESAAAAEAEAQLRSEMDRRVLVVEDEELVALELSSELSRLGWAIVGPAATVAEAQALLSGPLDAAILDVNLRGRPVYPIADALADRQVPFVFCTGYEVVDPDGRFADVPVIRKPANPAAVSAALAEMLRSRPH